MERGPTCVSFVGPAVIMTAMTLLYTDPLFLQHDTGRHPENADRLLGPGEKMVSFVCTDSQLPVRDELRGYSGKLLYRVRVRTGLAAIAGRMRSTTAVVGVEFDKNDIKDIPPPPG